jgi:hypothetical protein
MRRIYKLFVLCILLICQQHIVAQSYDLGKQKQSFAYQTLYANQHGISQVVKSNNETINHQPIQPLASVKNRHKEIVSNSWGGIVFKVYNNIYKSITYTHENILKLHKIQSVVLTYFESQELVYQNLKNQLKNTSSMEEQMNIFLSYSQEQ